MHSVARISIEQFRTTTPRYFSPQIKLEKCARKHSSSFILTCVHTYIHTMHMYLAISTYSCMCEDPPCVQVYMHACTCTCTCTCTCMSVILSDIL